jgi:Kef-type K+ transport system membrane component KefB
MTLLFHNNEITFPLSNPILVIGIILIIILAAPLVLNKFKIPYLIGLIIAGAVVGSHGFNLIDRGNVALFGTVGLLYIMFLAGIEIDIEEFRKNAGKGLVFGLLTFMLPMVMGYAAAYYLLNLSVTSSILLASMFASHTLIAYPLVSKLGVARNRAVNITVGGTMVTDTLALLVLAVIVGMEKGDVDAEFWIRLSVSTLLMAFVILFIFPLVARWFLKNVDQPVSQYIFILALLCLGGFAAELAGIEAIIGAFFTGLALNKLIPHTSALMNRIEFVGNALFIPFFLIGVGMLIDYKVFFSDINSLKTGGVMVFVAIVSKYLAALFTQKIFGYSADERRIIYGLSSAQAAATLAAVLVGYQLKIFDDAILNGTILMILITCTSASIITQKGASRLAILENTDDENDKDQETKERILLAVNSTEIAEDMLSLTLEMKSRRNREGLYALHVMSSSKNEFSEKNARKILEQLMIAAAATDTKVNAFLRFDVNTANGIAGVVKEHRITDLLLGVHEEKGLSDNFLGSLTTGILDRCNTNTYIFKSRPLMGQVKRYLVLVPPYAERELGFPFWVIKLWNLARNTGASFHFYGTSGTLSYLRDVQQKHPVPAEFTEFTDWTEFLTLSIDLKSNDILVVIMSRREHQSYIPDMQKVPGYLNKYFQEYNYIMVFPMQLGVGDDDSLNLKDPSAQESLEKLDDIRKNLFRLFRIQK